VPRDEITLVLRAQSPEQAIRRFAERRYRWARAYRDGALVCGRVELTMRVDTRLGLAPRERRVVAVRFLERLDPALRRELAGLVCRRGPAARRLADWMDPVELVFDDPRLGRQRIIGWLDPPRLRCGELREIEFGLRQPDSSG
jgi:hypothetical protein